MPLLPFPKLPGGLTLNQPFFTKHFDQILLKNTFFPGFPVFMSLPPLLFVGCTLGVAAVPSWVTHPTSSSTVAERWDIGKLGM